MVQFVFPLFFLRFHHFILNGHLVEGKIFIDLRFLLFELYLWPLGI